MCIWYLLNNNTQQYRAYLFAVLLLRVLLFNLNKHKGRRTQNSRRQRKRGERVREVKLNFQLSRPCMQTDKKKEKKENLHLDFAIDFNL